jgi:hypothetical protein
MMGLGIPALRVHVECEPQVTASHLRRSPSKLKSTTPRSIAGFSGGFQVTQQLHLLAADQICRPVEVWISRRDQRRRRGLAVMPSLDDSRTMAELDIAVGILEHRRPVRRTGEIECASRAST